MKTNTLQLPITVTRKLALAIVDQLPSEEYTKFVSDIRQRSRDRALNSLRRFRSAVRKSGLTHCDFTTALEEVRAQKAEKSTRHRH
jgi:Mg/Co/Ni transporter MgtE